MRLYLFLIPPTTGFRFLLLCCLLLLGSQLRAGTADQLYQQHHASIVQIRVIDIAAESKSAIGSGFVIGDGSLIATNYHVISSRIRKPDRYRIEVDSEGRSYSQLQVVDVDVINDLALLRWQDGSGQALPLATEQPRQGEPIFSFGNPMDIGMTVVPGTYNGLRENSFYQRVHLTASINPGMSGGPALNSTGEVIGVNVSTAGNQISFLVPVSPLQRLLQQYAERGRGVEDPGRRMASQLLGIQRRMYRQVIDADWPSDQIESAGVIGPMVPFVVCWGNSDEGKKSGLTSVSKGCHSDNHIYLDSHFNSGFFEYEFSYLDGSRLNSWQFYNALESAFSGARPGNRVTSEHVTGYRCEDDFFRTALAERSESVYQAFLCARRYRDFPELYDVFFMAATVNRPNHAVISHFTLAGVEKPLALRFARKFIGSVGWK